MTPRRDIAGFLPRGLALACLALPAAAQTPTQATDAGLPRVVYGNPAAGPQVLYGPSSAAPRERPPEPTRSPAPAPAPVAPQGSLSYETGPAYLPPPGYWGGWRPPPRWARRQGEPPPAPAPYVSPRGGAYEPPLPQGRYVGRPPGAPPTQPHYGRPPGY